MFLPALVKLGTPEQQAIWVPKAVNMSIIGTYAQTGTLILYFISGTKMREKLSLMLDCQNKKFRFSSNTRL